jgi:hypothetical protein
MATNISSDVSSNVNITARKGDSFYLKIEVTNSDGTVFSFDDYSDMQFEILNSNKTLIKKFTKSGTASTGTDEINKPGVITSTSSNGTIVIDLPANTLNTSTSKSYTNMNLLVGTYEYVFVLTGATQTHTIMDGKFKSVD